MMSLSVNKRAYARGPKRLKTEPRCEGEVGNLAPKRVVVEPAKDQSEPRNDEEGVLFLDLLPRLIISER